MTILSIRFGSIIIGIIVFLLPQGLTKVRAGELRTAGYVENVWLANATFALKAKLDTGAKTSSIHVRSFERFTLRGRDWVRFSIVNGTGQNITLERPIERIASIRRAGVGVQQRPIISLSVCVAGHTSETEFNLTDRAKMNYKALIGRTFLAGRILVDSGRLFLGSGLCQNTK